MQVAENAGIEGAVVLSKVEPWPSRRDFDGDGMQVR